MNEFKKKDRILWIDISKGFGILAIMIFHSGFLPNQQQLYPFITSCMIPIFIFTGGLLFSTNNSPTRFLISKFTSLIYPYLVYGGISFVLWMILKEYYPNKAIWMPTEQGFKYFIEGDDNMWFNGPLWFLPSYFISVVALRLLLYIIKSRNTVFLTIISIITGLISFWIMKGQVKQIYSWDISILFISIMLIGYCFANNIYLLLKSKKFIISIVTIYFIGAFINGTIDIFFRSFNNPLLFWLNAVTGSLTIIIISSLIEKRNLGKFLSYLGKNSLILMCIHWPVMQWLTYLLSLTGILSSLDSKIYMINFSLPNPNTLSLWIIQISLLLLYTLSPVLMLFGILRLNNLFYIYFRKSSLST